MSATADAQLTTVVDRTFAVDGQRLYQRLGTHLAERGFDVRQTEPPEAGSRPEEFRAGLRAERDVVLDATKRKVGKGLVIAGVLLTLLTLALMVTGEERRFVLEWLLTIEVIGGGYGLMLLKNPTMRRRTTVDVTLVGGAGGAHVLAREATGKVEDDVGFEWIDDPPRAITETDVEALASSEAEA